MRNPSDLTAPAATAIGASPNRAASGSPADSEVGHKVRFLHTVFMLAGIVASGMGFVRWQSSVLMGSIDFGFAGLCFALLFYLSRHKQHIELVCTLALALSFALFLAIYLLAPHNTVRLSLFVSWPPRDSFSRAARAADCGSAPSF